ncbi:MAG: hypothetical protein EOP04_03470 [Proteobacteria bacterium]|nr:MAG: hypothetical protein EOP04_03470 [Pseudomonadota bacterium]
MKIYELGNSFDENLVWEELFDFVMDHKNPNDLFDDQHSLDTLVERLTSFLVKFGMARTIKGGIYPKKQQAFLEDILKKSKESLSDYISEPNHANYKKAWGALWSSIDGTKNGFKTTPTMVSKILLGLRGSHPALDRNVMFSLGNHPALACVGIDTIAKTLEQLSEEGTIDRILTKSGKRPIPWPRVIDRVLWELGAEDNYWEMTDWLPVPGEKPTV